MTPRKAVERPAPRIIDPTHPNSPRYYEFDSESEPGRVHRVTVYRGEVKGCTCRGAAHNCWHKQEAATYESMIEENEAMTTEQNARAVAVRDPQLPSREVVLETRDTLPTTTQYDMMWAIAQTAKKAGAGMLPDNIKSPEAAMAVILAGHELGFPPFAALRQVFIVNGKTQLMSEGLYALMKQRDPSLEVVWHERGTEGAEASLWRRGVEVIRIRYDNDDRMRAHQGQKRGGGGGRKWLPLMKDGKQEVWPPGHPKAGEGKVRLNPDFDESAVGGWEDDPSSPWTGYPRDMYSWAVLKRLERFGAPDLVNLAPPQWTQRDEDEPIMLPPRQPLSAAIAEGKVTVQAASDATEPPDLEGNPDVPPEQPPEVHGFDEDEAQDDADAADGAWTDIAPPDAPEATPEAPQAQDWPLWHDWDATQLAAQKVKLHDRLVRMKASMSPGDYGKLARGIAKDFCGDEKNLDLDAMGAEQVYEAINRTVLAEGGDVSMYWGA